MITMYDTVDVATVPADAPAVAGYVGGSWPTYNELVHRFPRAHHLSIAVNAGENAECLDVEPGDATISEAAGWIRRQQQRGVQRPAVYISISSAATLLQTLEHAGIGREQIRLWTAHYTYAPHICGPGCGYGEINAQATQWTDRAHGRNLDQSLCLDSFLPGPAPPGTAAAKEWRKPYPPDPHHYDWYPPQAFEINGRHLSERACVREYDRLRAHPFIHRPRLHTLRDALSQLAGRVLTVAHEQPDPGGAPSWDQYHRGWRFQQLIHRAEGRRLA